MAKRSAPPQLAGYKFKKGARKASIAGSKRKKKK